MGFDPISEPSPGPSRPDAAEETKRLSQAQRAFAKVVGQALAEAWRRQREPCAGGPPLGSGGADGPGTRAR